ncbi:MAG: hypothetical protein RIC55_09295 [Pirellulaceae bacterium]
MRLPTISCQSRVRLSALLVVALVGTLLTSCIPSSRRPLLDESNSAIDESLLGEWWTIEGDRLEIKREESSKSLVISNGEEATPFRTASFDKLSIVSVADTGRRDHPKHEIAKYRLTRDGNLELFPLGEREIAKAIEANELEGTVVRNPRRGLFRSEFKRVEIDDSAENVLPFLQQHAEEAFSKRPLLTFYREKPVRERSGGNPFKLPLK